MEGIVYRKNGGKFSMTLISWEKYRKQTSSLTSLFFFLSHRIETNRALTCYAKASSEPNRAEQVLQAWLLLLFARVYPPRPTALQLLHRVEDLAGGRTSMGPPNFAARPRDERHPSAGAGPEASKEREERDT